MGISPGNSTCSPDRFSEKTHSHTQTHPPTPSLTHTHTLPPHTHTHTPHRAVVGEIDETDSDINLDDIRAEPLNPVVH